MRPSDSAGGEIGVAACPECGGQVLMTTNIIVANLAVIVLLKLLLDI